MPNCFLRILVATLAATAIAAASGCLAVVAGAAAGAGTYAYMQGEMTTTFEAHLDRVWNATEQAVEQLEFEMERHVKDALQGRMTVRQADGKRVRIRLDLQTEELTDVRVRVGVFGDETKSRLLLDKIRNNLKM